jgi:acetolactate synthase I/II/III large subunit
VIRTTSPVKHSDQLIDWLCDLGYTHCFFVAGGNIMHLLDSARTRMKCIPVVHEVAAGIAAEYFNQVSPEQRAFALVTAGPGLTNIVTAIGGAWLEHRDLLVIGGQVKSADLMTGGLRQRGIQEIDGVSIVRSVTKRAVRIEEPVDESFFKEVVQDGLEPRRGPVFVEVCLDAQGGPPNVTGGRPSAGRPQKQGIDRGAVDQIIQLMAASARPTWLIGAGVDRETAWKLRDQLEALQFPLLTTWHGADRLSSESSNYFGRPETWGQRLGNLIVNQADLLVVFGARLGLQETGFNWQKYAKNAQIVQIDIDENELRKGHPKIAYPLTGDANSFLAELIDAPLPERTEWLTYCRTLREALPLNETCNETGEGFVSPYEFYLEASRAAGETDIWVPASSGGANSVAIQALNQRGHQKVVCDNGLASMGYGLSGAIGASFAAPDSRIWLVEGDGGFTQNLQELATVAVSKLNIKMFLFCNNGYGSIRTTQKNYFSGDYLGCDTNTGLGFPEWQTLAAAYGIEYIRFGQDGVADSCVKAAIENPGPILVEVPIDPLQTYWPKITSRVTENGNMESNPLYQMSPDLPEDVWHQVSRYL